MDFLIRLSQSHETFRLPELESLALIEEVDLEVVFYSLKSPFCIVRLPDVSSAIRLVRRAVLAQSIHELWAQAPTLDALHAAMRSSTSHPWTPFRTSSFKFAIDSYQGSRSNASRLALIDSMSPYLPLDGPIRMRDPDLELTIFENFPRPPHPRDPSVQDSADLYCLGRRIPGSTTARAGGLSRRLDLKTRRYISTTSMDAELSLVAANMALAASGALVYDPFVGTGSFPLACAQFGALALGSDIDGRAIRGDGARRTIRANFEQYGLLPGLGGVFAADLTNSPIRRNPLGERGGGGGGGGGGKARDNGVFDAIICDPPYGVREGLRVLGVRDPEKRDWIIPKGKELYKAPDFVPPKKPYSFLAMLDDILHFSAQTLVDNGRLVFWMPTANDENQEIAVPAHPYLEIVAICTQDFNRWSRRLITYRRLTDADVGPGAARQLQQRAAAEAEQGSRDTSGKTANDLNPFRKRYFSGFKDN